MDEQNNIVIWNTGIYIRSIFGVIQSNLTELMQNEFDIYHPLRKKKMEDNYLKICITSNLSLNNYNFVPSRTRLAMILLN